MGRIFFFFAFWIQHSFCRSETVHAVLPAQTAQLNGPLGVPSGCLPSRSTSTQWCTIGTGWTVWNFEGSSCASQPCNLYIELD